MVPPVQLTGVVHRRYRGPAKRKTRASSNCSSRAAKWLNRRYSYPTRADVIRNFCVDLRHLCSIDASEGVVALVEFSVKYATRGCRTLGNADHPHTSFATCTT